VWHVSGRSDTSSYQEADDHNDSGGDSDKDKRKCEVRRGRSTEPLMPRHVQADDEGDGRRQRRGSGVRDAHL